MRNDSEGNRKRGWQILNGGLGGWKVLDMEEEEVGCLGFFFFSSGCYPALPGRPLLRPNLPGPYCSPSSKDWTTPKSTMQVKAGDECPVASTVPGPQGVMVFPFLLHPPHPKSILRIDPRLEQDPKFRFCYRTGLEGTSASHTAFQGRPR